ncbi:MAG: thioesterase family protein [Sandaracinaceae bacterium]
MSRLELPRREDFVFFHPLRVRWSEVDRQDVVFNPNYFVYFDVAVGEYWRATGFRYPQDLAGTDIFTVDAHARFLASATYDDELVVGVRTARMGRSSMTAQLGIWRGEELTTAGELVYVHTDLATKKSAPWPAAVVAAFAAYERVAPSRD